MSNVSSLLFSGREDRGNGLDPRAYPERGATPKIVGGAVGDVVGGAGMTSALMIAIKW